MTTGTTLSVTQAGVVVSGTTVSVFGGRSNGITLSGTTLSIVAGGAFVLNANTHMSVLGGAGITISGGGALNVSGTTNLRGPVNISDSQVLSIGTGGAYINGAFQITGSLSTNFTYTLSDNAYTMSVAHNSRISSLEWVLSRDGSNNVYLGQNVSNIYIGSPNNTTTAQNIYIGTANDNVYISGTLVALQTVNTTISDARITLNKGALTGTNAGIEIEINGTADAATWTINGAGEWVAKNTGGATFNLSTMSNIVYASLSTLNVSVVNNAFVGGYISVVSDVWVGRNLSVIGDVYLSRLSVLSTVFIGQDLNVVSNVSVGGEIRCIGDVVAFYNTCDARLKTDVVTISTALETVNRLRPVEFTWKDDIQNVDRRNTRDAGFIAQEIHGVIPYTEMFMGPAIEGGDEPIRGVRHERVIPYLVKAIQELTAELSELRSRL